MPLVFREAHADWFRRKLGLAEWREDDDQLLQGLFRVLSAQGVDYPRFFRLLARFPDPALGELFEDPRGFDAWAAFYRERVAEDAIDPAARRVAMERVNPKYVLRGHLAEAAIARAMQRDFSEVARLRQILAQPFAEQPEHEAYALPPPAGSPPVVLSCSS